MSGNPKIPPEAAEVAAEAMRHLWWLRDAGVREISIAPAPRPAGPVAAHALSDKGCGSESLLAIRSGLGDCTRCKLHGGRTRLVFGVGNP